MKTWKLLLSLLMALSLIATACGGSDDDGDTATSDDAETTEVESGDSDDDAMDDDEGEDHSDDDAMDDEDDAMDDEDDAMDEEDDAMDEEDDDAAMASDDEAMADSGAGSGGTLTLIQWQAPSQVNAHLSSGSKDVLAGSLILEPLGNIAPDGSVVPRLAAEIPTIENGGISEDLTTITWTLLPDVMWSDGTPLTADDVVFTWEYCADELTGCTTADSIAGVASVEALDDLTVQITFDAPTPYPFQPFVGHQVPILQRAQFADCIGEGSAACSDQNFFPVGTGPFMMSDFSPEDVAVYVMNPNYRGVAEGKPFFSDVVIQGGGEAESAARAVLETGEADYAWNMQIAPEIINPMIDRGLGDIQVAFTSSVEHINVNQSNNRADGDASSDIQGGANPHPILFQAPELLEALSIAIDRELIVEIGYGNAARATCNMWNVGVQNSTNLDWCLERDVDRANQILDDAGYADTDGDGVRETPDGLPLSFSYATSVNAVRQSTQDIIKANWAEIGVEVEMTAVEASIFFDGTNADQSIWRFPTDMEMFTNLPSNPAPESYMGGWKIEETPTLENAWGGSNIPRQQSEEFDSIIDELEQTPMSDPGRNDLAIRANDILSFEGGATIPLALRGSVSAFSNALENVGDLNGWDSEYWNIADWTRAG